MSTDTVGFIGLGSMGGAIALKLASSGVTLCVHDPVQAAVGPNRPASGFHAAGMPLAPSEPGASRSPVAMAGEMRLLKIVAESDRTYPADQEHLT